jgi:hypothetical protein
MGPTVFSGLLGRGANPQAVPFGRGVLLPLPGTNPLLVLYNIKQIKGQNAVGLHLMLQ